MSIKEGLGTIFFIETTTTRRSHMAVTRGSAANTTILDWLQSFFSLYLRE